jgi:hypothetical protein
MCWVNKFSTPFVIASLNKFRSNNVFYKSHNNLHGLTLCAIIVFPKQMLWLPHLCTSRIQLSVRSLGQAVNFKHIQPQRPGMFSNDLNRHKSTEDLKMVVLQWLRTNLRAWRILKIIHFAQSRCGMLLETKPERLTAVIAAKGTSTMYWLVCEYLWKWDISVSMIF